MPDWQLVSRDITQAYDAAQGREVTLGFHRQPCKVKLFHKAGVRRTLGVWGKDKNNREIMIFNTVYGEGQEVLIDADWSEVHVAVNFAPDDPPKNKRWFFQGLWYRQAYYAAEVALEIYYYR